MLKAVLLHSGEAISRYSGNAHDSLGLKILSFQIKSPGRPDVFQGHGSLLLDNVVNRTQDLYVQDELLLSADLQYEFLVNIPEPTSLTADGALKVIVIQIFLRSEQILIIDL